MSSNVAILQVLAFLGTAALVVGLTIGVVVAWLIGKAPLAGRLLILDGVLVAGYGIVLVVAAALSRDRVVARGQKKYFCEIDCHLADEVVAVERANSIGAVRPAGAFYLVTVRTWFDPATTSPNRPKDAVVYPNPRAVYLVAADGRRFAPSVEGMGALAGAGREGTPITRPLLPDSSYLTTFAFEAPADLVSPRLWLADDDVVAPLVIGHERSWLHGKTVFAL